MITDVGGSGTVAQSQDALGNYSKAVLEANQKHQELGGKEGKELQEQLAKTDDAVAKTKASAAETTADVLVAVGGVAAAPFTGGLSLAGTIEAMGALGAVGAIANVARGPKARLMGNDYEWSMSQVATDAGSGFAEKRGRQCGRTRSSRQISWFWRKSGGSSSREDSGVPGRRGGSFESLLKQGGKEELTQASKELMAKSIAEGAKKIEGKEIQAVAEKVVASGLTGEARKESVTQLLRKHITETENLGKALKRRKDPARWSKMPR